MAEQNIQTDSESVFQSLNRDSHEAKWMQSMGETLIKIHEEKISNVTLMVTQDETFLKTRHAENLHKKLKTNHQENDQVKKIPAHRSILSASSPYFAAMFSTAKDGAGCWKESSNEEVKIVAPSIKAAELAVRYIYTGAGNVMKECDDSELFYLLATARLLLIDSLVTFCLTRTAFTRPSR